MKNQRVLVTGASGFIGAVLVEKLIAKQYCVSVLIRDASKIPISWLDANITVYLGSITDSRLLYQACNKIDVVIHLAAFAHVQKATEKIYALVNINAVKQLLDACIKRKVVSMIYMSSIKALDATETAVQKQTLPPRKITYATSKYAAEKLLLDQISLGKIEGCCIRPVPVYGPGMKGNILTLIKLIRLGLLPPLPNIAHRVSLVGVDDLCNALMLCVQSTESNGQTYVVSDDVSYRLKDIENAIRLAVGKSLYSWCMPKELLYIAAWGMEMLSKIMRIKTSFGFNTYRTLTEDGYFSCEQIKQQLNYSPSQSFQKELPKIMKSI